MTPHYSDPSVTLFHGDCLDVLRTLPDASVDAVVTDPPYGLSAEPDMTEVMRHWLAGDDYTHRGAGFMSKSWDSFVPGPAIWRECFRALKPGGHLLAFVGSRKATAAHPNCICGKPNPRAHGWQLAGRGDLEVLVWTQGGTYGPADCPQHKPNPR